MSRLPLIRIAYGSLLLLLSCHATAAPTLSALAEPATAEAPGCPVRAAGPRPAPGTLVLHWTGATATMQIDGQPEVLVVTEARCTRNCVGPRRRGVRVFHFRNPAVRATLHKQVFCPRDAEVCGGLPKGPARLEIETAQGRAVLAVHNPTCDL